MWIEPPSKGEREPNTVIIQSPISEQSGNTLFCHLRGFVTVGEQRRWTLSLLFVHLNCHREGEIVHRSILERCGTGESVLQPRRVEDAIRDKNYNVSEGPVVFWQSLGNSAWRFPDIKLVSASLPLWGLWFIVDSFELWQCPQMLLCAYTSLNKCLRLICTGFPSF